MSLPRISIRATLFAVVLIAVDFAIIREIWGNSAYPIVFGVFGIAVTTHFLAIVAYRSFSQKTTRQPFLIGFISAGALAVFAWFSYCVFSDESRLHFLVHLMGQIMRSSPYVASLATKSHFEPIDIAYLTTLQIAIMSGYGLLAAIPQLAVAFAGGWLARRFSLRVPAASPAKPQVV